MIKKNIIIAASVAAVLIISFLALAPGKNTRILGKNITLANVTENGQPTGEGQVSVTYLSHAAEIKYINIAVDINGDGRIGIIQANGQAQDEWVTLNQQVQPEKDQTDSFTFLLPEQFKDGKKKVTVLLSDETLPTTSWPEKSEEIESVSKSVKIETLAK